MRSTRTGRRIAALTATMALATLGTLGTTLPAHAAPAADAPTLPKQAVAEAPGVTVQAPDAAKRPAQPRSVTELGKSPKIALTPQAKGMSPRMVDGAQVADAGCTPYIGGTITKSGLNVRIDYWAELVCNFYLAAAGQAYLIERTSGSPYNGQIVAAAPVFSFTNGYYGYSAGAVLIDGRVYDGGANMEIGFSLALQAPNGVTWAGCLPLLNGMRYLTTCSGLGTSLLSVSVGSGVFATGLPPDRLAVLESLTSVGPASFTAWNNGRLNPATYAAYQFDWSTDYCTWAPDNPLGFPFELPCARHDFGYRNYKAAQRFPQNKDRIDLAFYTDMQQVCAPYPGDIRNACLALAQVYYEAVQRFGSLNVTQEQIDEIAKLMPDTATAKPGKAS